MARFSLRINFKLKIAFMGIYINLHSTEMCKICTNIIKSIRKHVIRIFGMVFYRENVYPYF